MVEAIGLDPSVCVFVLTCSYGFVDTEGLWPENGTISSAGAELKRIVDYGTWEVLQRWCLFICVVILVGCFFLFRNEFLTNFPAQMQLMRHKLLGSVQENVLSFGILV